MKRILKAAVAVGLLGAFGASTVLASGKNDAGVLSPVSECMKIADVTQWKVLDDQHMVVKALGGRYFDISLKNKCPDLQKRTAVRFRDGYPSKYGSGASSDGRICGDAGDAVIPRDLGNSTAPVPCYISSIRPSDGKAWEGRKAEVQGVAIASD